MASVAVLIAVPATDALAQAGGDRVAGEPVQVRVWLDRGGDAIVQAGERARVYYRASRDAHVAVFHIDTDGLLRLLFPAGPAESSRIRAERDYRLRFDGSPDWLVSDMPGLGYFFILASEAPFDFASLTPFAQTGDWALARTGARIRQDPHVAMAGLRSVLLPADGSVGFAMDFVGYQVGQSYSYPRFLCYGCHVPQAFEDWNPYHQACPDIRVVIHNDPHFYPASRYQGSRVAYPHPSDPGQPQFAVRARLPGEPGTPLVQPARTGPVTGRPEPDSTFLHRMVEAGVLNSAGGQSTSDPDLGRPAAGPTVPGRAGPSAPAAAIPRSEDPDARPSLQRRVSQEGEPLPPR